MDKSLRKEIFENELNSPAGWLVEAQRLKDAAERLNYWQHVDAPPGSPDAGLSSMLHIFKLLLGLSFENLLKGIIVAQRSTGGKNGRVDGKLITHEMGLLLKQLNQEDVAISEEEIAMLRDLEKYVVWAGCYPLSKDEDKFFVKSHSSREYEVAISFWNRLYSKLEPAALAAGERPGWRMYGR